MSKGLGHLFRFMFGGKRPLSTSAANVVGARHHDLVEAPAASVDLLRRAMEAATQSPPHVETERVVYAPPVEIDDSLPTMFLHGVTALSEELKAEEAAPEPEPEVDIAPVPEIEPQPEISAEAPIEPEETAVPHFVEPEPPVEENIIEEIIIEVAQIEELPQPETLADETPAEPVPVETATEAVLDAETEMESTSAEMALQEELPAEEVASAEPEPEPEATEAAVKKPAKKRSPAKKKAATPKRKKAEAEDLPLPADEVFLSDAVIWSQCGSWREFWLPPTDANSSQRIDEFRNMAAEGKLTIWGQTEGTATWRAIDPAHWKKNGFDPLSFLAGRENVYSEAKPPKSKAKTPPPPVRYSSLKVSKAEVEALWNSDAAQAAA